MSIIYSLFDSIGFFLFLVRSCDAVFSIFVLLLPNEQCSFVAWLGSEDTTSHIAAATAAAAAAVIVHVLGISQIKAIHKLM